MSKVFLDTNILVYSLDQADAAKMAKCRGLIRSLTAESRGVISTQVMQNFMWPPRANWGQIRC
jgi:predicted nucleic acid-binding protein